MPTAYPWVKMVDTAFLLYLLKVIFHIEIDDNPNTNNMENAQERAECCIVFPSSFTLSHYIVLFTGS